VRGALSVAVAFAVGPFVIVCAVAFAYVRFGSTWELRALFFGVGPVVIALIAKSCFDLGKKTLRQEWLAYVVALVACLITLIVQQELTAIFIVAGVLGIVVFAPAPDDSGASSARDAGVPVSAKSLAVGPIGALVGIPNSAIFWFFFKTGFLVFGSGLVVVPFLKAYIVDQYHWLTNRAFLDAVAIGIISPGPVVITATFVGFLLNNFSGALAATAGMFAPSILFVVIGTPLLRRHRRNRRVRGFIRGITVAVVGVLVGTSILVAKSSISDWVSATILAVALIALLSKWKLPDQVLIGAGGIVGLVAFGLNVLPH